MKKGMMGLALLAAGLAQGAALDGGTVYAWRGEKVVVWFDAMNRTPAAALWRPSSACAFVRAGLAMPVKGDGDRLYADRVVWGGAALGFAAVWLVPCLPGWVWLAGSGIFWGVFPALALGMVRRKKFEK